jgi:hypothetical protein
MHGNNRNEQLAQLSCLPCIFGHIELFFFFFNLSFFKKKKKLDLMLGAKFLILDFPSFA